jgi:hypothetical protein
MTAEHLSNPEVQAKAREARRKAPRRREKMAVYAETFAKQRREFPKIALPIIVQAERGSMVAAVKLKCLDCSGWVKQEVRDCTVVECPLFPFRPYRAIMSKNPNDPGAAGMTDRLRATTGLSPRA